mgnify:CR=1 FL=1
MKKNKIPKYRTEEQEEIIRFIVILIIVIAFVLGIYFFTKNIVKKTKIDTTENVTEGQIDYSKVTVGTMLNKSDETYYVIVYNSEDIQSPIYSTIASKYSENEKSLPIYTCDLANTLNKDYVAQEESNPKATKIEELAFKEFTLLKIKNGKINKYIEGLDSIRSELGL